MYDPARGCGHAHRLGHGGDKHVTTPTLVKGELTDRWVVAVAVGSCHVNVVCRDGTILGWGRNEQAQVGVGNFETVSTPTVVSSVSDKELTNIIAGPTQVCACAAILHLLHSSCVLLLVHILCH